MGVGETYQVCHGCKALCEQVIYGWTIIRFRFPLRPNHAQSSVNIRWKEEEEEEEEEEREK